MRYEFGYRYQERFHRNVWGSYGSVRKWASEVGNTDVYSSVFGYSGEINAGVVYAGLYFDLDSPDLNQALEDTNALISIFDNHDLTPDSYRVSFSGKKGFHVYVSPVALDVAPSTELPASSAVWPVRWLNCCPTAHWTPMFMTAAGCGGW